MAGGRVASIRSLPPGGGATVEVRAALAEADPPAELPEPSSTRTSSPRRLFLRRPPPELAVVPLERSGSADA